MNHGSQTQDLGGCRSRPFPLETSIDLKVSSTQGVERKRFTLSVQGAGRKKGSQSEGVEATGSEFGARKKEVGQNKWNWGEICTHFGD